MRWTFSPGYFVLAVILFGIEVLIALFLNDAIIRPYVGDLLVVVLMYCAVRSFIQGPVWPITISVLAFAYLVEYSQYLQLIDRLGWRENRLANVVMGNRFEWIDMLAYTIGAACVILVETFRRRSARMDMKQNHE